MEPILISDTDRADGSIDEQLLVHTWRAEQLRRLGLSRILAETFAEIVDWRELVAPEVRGRRPGRDDQAVVRQT